MKKQDSFLCTSQWAMGIRNEKGDPIEFFSHPFLLDIYDDQSQNLVVMKAAQVGMSTCQILKNHRDAKNHKMDIIYCVDEETEILTQRGFLFNQDLTDDDYILTMSVEGKVAWLHPEYVFRKEVDMDCTLFEARNFNALVTPNHRWLLQPYRGSGSMFFRETKDMVGKYARIPKVVNDGAARKTKKYRDEYVALLAWIFAEGNYPRQTKGSGKKSYSVIITQSEGVNADYCDEIRGLLRILGITWKEYLAAHSLCINFRFAFDEGRKIRERFPDKKPDAELAMELTRDQCKLFIDTFVKADGWIDSSGTQAIAQKDKDTSDILCMIAALAGYVPSLIKSNGCHTIRMTQFKTVETAELKPQNVRYKGTIWCPSTPNGTFYARRKGRCYWTGNTLPTDADVKVFVGGKVNRIIANNPTMLEDVSDKDSIEQKQVGGSMIYFRGCIDEKTEVLTQNGWCDHKNVLIGDKLPSLNITTNTIEMDEVLDMTSFETNEDMVRVESSLIDQLVTQDHRCVIAKRKLSGEKSKLRIERAHNMVGKKSAHIPTIFKQKQIEPDPFFSIVGWVIGDGSYWTKRDKHKDKVYETDRIVIIQSKLCEELEQDLDKAGIKFHKKERKTCFGYELSTNDSRRIRRLIPEKKLTMELVFTLNKKQLQGVFHGLMMSDGDNHKGTTLWQRQNGTCDAFQALLVLLGKTSNKGLIASQENRFGTQQMERVRIRKNSWTNPTVGLEKYSGIAWCPTTKNGTIIIRRNGKVSVTGQTWTKKAAIMVTGDRLVHDEKDSSKLDIIADFQARLQHSKFKQTHTFSHPSLPETGVHNDWLKSDQKHWHVTCKSCDYEQSMSWNTEDPDKMSIDIEKRIYICKKCKAELSDADRATGRWISRYPDREWSGYWVPLLIAPWVSAGDLVDKFQNKDTTTEFFYTKILGLPYADGTSKLLRSSFFQNLTGHAYAPSKDKRVIIGIDTGLRLDYVIGDATGLFYHGDCSDYDELDALMKRWPKAIAVVDQGGDLIGSRKFYERWIGRVYLCALTGDRTTKELVRWSKGDEHGAVTCDRNRMIQLVVDEFRNKRVAVHGTEDDWFEYWTDWNNLAKIKILDPVTNQVKGYKWVRSGRDHRALATIFWRVGMQRFQGMGDIIHGDMEPTTNSYMLNPDNTVSFDPLEMFDRMEEESQSDWRV